MSYALIVAKFGGTSVANFAAMNRSADIILTNADTRLVVLSASAGITNFLISLSRGKKLIQRNLLINKIRCIQYEIIDNLKCSNLIRNKIDAIINNINMLSKSALLSTSTILTDELLSYGELMSTLLFVEILRERNINVKWFDIRKVIYTDNNFGHANPKIEIIAKQAILHIKPLIKTALVVTQGFIGSECKGKTTTLGRGGSDYTAALLGEALQASRVDIWTDVIGIYTTDPHIVPKAKRIDEISFKEASEMAIFGAKVLHPSTLLPAIRCDIPVFIGSSKEPKIGGTYIFNKTNSLPLFRALTLRREQILLTLHSINMLHTPGFLVKVLNIIAYHNISINLITTSEVSVAFTIDSTYSIYNTTNLVIQKILTKLSSLCNVKIEENLSLIAIIGNDLSKAKGVGKKIFSILDSFNLRMICYGASNHNICFLVHSVNAENIIKTLHYNLFE